MTINVLQTVPLPSSATTGQTATVGEPTVGNNDQEVFYAGNWYASRTANGGGSWTFVDPFRLLPPAAGGFCCDQVALYDPSHNLFVWLLQYVRDNQGTNVLRVAVKNGGTLADDVWDWWDFSPGSINAAWSAEWFDFPDVELGTNFLYVSTNSFQGNTWRRSVVLRLPLASLVQRGSLSFQYFASTQNFALRCVRGAGATMYFASQNGTSQVRIFAWPESDPSPSVHDVNVSTWNAGRYSAPGPDGSNWLARCDARITGAWLANGIIGLAWSANSRGSRPFPYARVVEISEDQMQVVADRDIWSQNYAYAYPNAAPNDQGEIGITLFRGGNRINPGHVVGGFDDRTQTWQLQATRDGTNGPSDNKWGDYLTCRPHTPDGQSWIASGYTLQGGGTRRDVEPLLVRFEMT
jgi:hypothetical protein